jgi:hypothetical protein
LRAAFAPEEAAFRRGNRTTQNRGGQIPLYRTGFFRYTGITEGIMPTAKATTKKPVKKVPRRPIKGITAEDVWAGFEELRKLNAETEKALKEANARTERTLNKALGGLSNAIGALIEHVMTASLPEKFKKFGFSFNRVTTVKWAGGENNIYTEIDGLLENGDQAMAVEVKMTLRNEDIDDHLTRMERVRKYADLHDDKREFFSAIAAGNVSKSAREYALKKGLFVIEPAGEDVKITKPVSAKVW